MIRLICGNLGSSKTTNAVRLMVNDTSGLKTYTNIETKKIPNAVYFPNEKLFTEQEVTVGNKTKTKFVFNAEYWLSLKKPLNICADEFVFIADSRESSSQKNKAVSEFIYMARRIIGSDKYGYGDFTVIVQKPNTVDLRLRQLTTDVVYNILHWVFYCEYCAYMVSWNSEKPNLKICPYCNRRTLIKEDFKTEQYHFMSVDDLNTWLFLRQKTYYRRNFITDIGDYFEYFETHQYMKNKK